MFGLLVDVPARLPCFASRITHHTSHITHHTSHITHHTSHITHHTPRITHHTSHITHHTSHITHHTSPITQPFQCFMEQNVEPYGKQGWRCLLCQKKFSTENLMAVHFSRRHRDEALGACVCMRVCRCLQLCSSCLHFNCSAPPTPSPRVG